MIQKLCRLVTSIVKKRFFQAYNNNAVSMLVDVIRILKNNKKGLKDDLTNNKKN